MELVKQVLRGYTLILSLNRPDKKNALTRQMYQALADAIEAAGNDEQIKVIHLRGEGDCFTAGNDISDFANKAEQESVAETSAFMLALADTQLPVVCEVHGMAVGIGTTLLLHCDLVYCSDDAAFVLPFINLGLVPEYASSYLLPRLAGHRKAAEWLMLGEPFGPHEAVQFGLANKVLSKSELAAYVEQVCDKLCAKPRFALSHTKALMDNEKNAIHEHMNEEMDIFLEALHTEAATEAFDAFLNKRPIDKNKFK